MRPSPNRGKGRPPVFVKDGNGREVYGLSATPFKRDPQGNVVKYRYYVTFSKPKRWLGTDRDKAIFKLRQLEASRTEAAVRFEALDEQDLLIRQLDLREDLFWEKVRDEILADPANAAQKTGITELGHLHTLTPPAPSPTLDIIGRAYRDKTSITPHERRKSELYWKEFTKAVNVSTVRELTQAHIANYYDLVMAANKSQTYVKHRFGKIKTIFNFAQSRGIASEELGTILAYCKMLKPPRSCAAAPHPISREDFHSLLNAATDKWQAILLCALNFTMYGKEIADLERSDINLARQTLVTDRQKTGITRVAVLWDQTARAITALPEHGRSHVFLSHIGEPYHPDHIRRGFDRLRRKAGVRDDVKISDMRDGAYTAAIEAGANPTHAQILAGHRTGIKDYYVKRNPRMVADACAAIEKHYFG